MPAALDPRVGEFRLTHPNVKLRSRGSIYSLNEGNRGSWDAPLREYLQFAEPDLEDAPWFAASFPPALELRHALETYRFLVARAAPS